jgi:hypothetical protein
MVRIYDPVRITHPQLRDFAFQAAWISVVTEAANDLEDLNVDVPHAQRLLPDFSTPWPWEFDSVVVAVTVIRRNRDAAALSLEEGLAGWLGEDPEHWPRFRRTLIDPWQERLGIWSADTPEWARTLGAIGETAHGRNERDGRLPDGCGDDR